MPSPLAEKFTLVYQAGSMTAVAGVNVGASRDLTTSLSTTRRDKFTVPAGAREARIVAIITNASAVGTTTIAYPAWNLDGSANWNAWEASGTGLDVLMTAASLVDTGWVSITSGVFGSALWVTWLQYGTNTASSVAFGSFRMHFR